MSEIVVSRDVPAAGERVWAIVTDLDGSPDVLTQVRSVERLDGASGFGVGTRWRETRVVFGREATEEMEVTAMEPGRSYTVEAGGRGAQYRSIIGVEPLGEGSSRLTMTFGAQPQGLVAKAMAATVGRLFARATRRALERDLDDIAAAATTSGR